MPAGFARAPPDRKDANAFSEGTIGNGPRLIPSFACDALDEQPDNIEAPTHALDELGREQNDWLLHVRGSQGA
jgi:hypothetical protein